MKRPVFNRNIDRKDFASLFITELGWNNPTGPVNLPAIEIDGVAYRAKIVAQRNGFQVMTCSVESMPSTSVCRRLDLKLRQYANEYLIIFTLNGHATHHLWLAPVKKVDKRDIVTTEYSSADQAEFIYQKIDNLAFGFDEVTTIVDVRDRVQGSFAVNSEKITKDFYAGFKKEHKAFAGFIKGIEGTATTEHDRQWYASVMLNRLMFCYFIQKKGFLNGEDNYLRSRFQKHVTGEQDGTFFRSFYLDFLRSLFANGLNDPRHSEDFEARFGKIPYLNGGMFDTHKIENDYADLDIADEAFERLFAFFDKWNWHLDTRITASGKDINPDVLGYIFEQYINDRAQMGAYYTKEDITEYIGRNCILPFLFDKTKDSTSDAKSYFTPNGFVWTTLRESGDSYIFDAVKHGYSEFADIPENISVGIDTTAPNLLERRKDWNTRTPERWGLPTEIWRETIERLQRCGSILAKIRGGEINSINDFITYNLDIRQFAQDLLGKADHKFVGWFYKSLQNVSILDPTCGSGAFLFAALNILEPLYEICIDRMQDFNRANPNLFKDQLAEITAKYRSNIQYFIFKSIILRNLYGVDIMVEATEIAKLRLFLKMVAVVDVDRRAENMGLDPLPDIDFNIRCGNTLVGYATEAELNRDLTNPKDILEELANQDFKAKIDEEMEKVKDTYNRFRDIQLNHGDDMTSFKRAKHDLKERLAALNEQLNLRLHSATSNLPYEEWLTTHQPFHWLAEYYGIVQGNGGFDVIIGNPPYVEYSKRNVNYRLDNLQTLKASNLYAFVFERSFTVGKDKIGLIVQLSALGTDSMKSLQRYLLENSAIMHYGCFPERPQQLFDGACIALSIFLCQKQGNKALLSCGIKRVAESYRDFLFKSLSYTNIEKNDFLSGYTLYPKFKIELERSIYSKIAQDKCISQYLGISKENALTYRTAGGRYWKIVLNRQFANESTSNKTKSLSERVSSFELVSVLNSNLFWWFYANFFDLYNFKDYMIFAFPYTSDESREAKIVKELGEKLMASYEANKIENTQFIKSKQQLSIFESFNPSKSKSIIDKIDNVLAEHYGFTEEELDFIINYDIKYRMGDELNTEE